VCTTTDPAHPQAAPGRNDDAIIAICIALGGFALPVLFPVALVLGRRAMQKGFSGADHRGLAVTAYSIGWIGTAFWVVLILVLVVGGAISIIVGGGGGGGGGPPIQPPG